MRKLSALFLVLSGTAAASSAHAVHGVVDMSWDACSPVVSHKVNSTAPASLMFSELGSDETHIAYQVRFVMSAAGPTWADRVTPDAWRFDATGCQTDALIAINSFPPTLLVKSCPAFKGANSLEIKNFATFPPSDPLPFLETQMRGLLAVTYSAATALPTQRYFLGQFLFNHQFSVDGAGTPGLTCGDNDVPVCFLVIQPTGYVRQSDGIEYPFDIGNNFVTYGPTPAAGCPNTPARQVTWGQVKGQYRH